jgi:chromosome segregation ATPase
MKRDIAMKNKNDYLKASEIKVKKLLADLYEEDSNTLKELGRVRAKFSQQINELEEKEKELTKKRTELEKHFNQLKKADAKTFNEAKDRFEISLNYAEGDKENFIEKAEAMIGFIGDKITDYQEKLHDAAEDTSELLQLHIDDLQATKDELIGKIDKIKTGGTETWKDVKYWFLEKKESVKEYISSIGNE